MLPWHAWCYAIRRHVAVARTASPLRPIAAAVEMFPSSGNKGVSDMVVVVMMMIGTGNQRTHHRHLGMSSKRLSTAHTDHRKAFDQRQVGSYGRDASTRKADHQQATVIADTPHTLDDWPKDEPPPFISCSLHTITLSNTSPPTADIEQ